MKSGQTTDQNKTPANPEDDSKTRILEAALLEFQQKGQAGARMQEIADRAGVNKAMLHYYFRDKAGLYQATLQEVFQEIYLLMSHPPRELLSRRSLIEWAVGNAFQFFGEKPEIVSIMMSEVVSGAATLKKIFTALPEGSSPRELFTVKKIKEFQASGEIRADLDPEHIALTLLGTVGMSQIQHRVLGVLPGAQAGILQNYFADREKNIIEIMERGLAPDGE